VHNTKRQNIKFSIIFLWFYSPIQALAASMKLSVSLQLLDLGRAAGLLGWVISSSQDLYLYTNTEKRTNNTNTKHPWPEWDSASAWEKILHALDLDRSATVTLYNSSLFIIVCRRNIGFQKKLKGVSTWQNQQQQQEQWYRHGRLTNVKSTYGKAVEEKILHILLQSRKIIQIISGTYLEGKQHLSVTNSVN
jgi:hypothetical protein